MKSLVGGLCLLLLCAAQAHAQEMTLLTVDQCVESALKKNPLIGISQQHVRQAQARLVQGRGEMLPVLSTDLYAAVSTDQPVVTWSTVIQQPVFLGGELMAKKERAQTGLAISKKESILVQSELAYVVRKTFFEIKKAEMDVHFLQEELAYLKSLLYANQKLRRADYITEDVVLERKAGVGDKEKELLEGEKHLEYLYATLLGLTGLDSGKAYVLEDRTGIEPDEALPAWKIKNQALLDILDLQVTMLQKDIAIAKADLFPKVNLVSKYRKEKDSFYEKDALEAGVLVHWNIWDFGVTTGKIEESKSKLAEGMLQKDFQLQQYGLALNKARDIFLTQRKVVLVNRQVVDSAEEQFKNVKVRHMHGDVPDQSRNAMQLRLLKAKTEFGKSIYDYYISEAEVLKLLGIAHPAGQHE